MYMKFVTVIYSIPFFLFQSLMSQNDSTYLYFPLNIGDHWQYRVTVSDLGQDDSIYFELKTVVQELLMPNGLLYKEVQTYWENQSFIEYEYFRIDTSAACIYQYINGMEILKDSLNIKEGEKFTISDSTAAGAYIALYGECTKIDSINLFDRIVTTKTIDLELLENLTFLDIWYQLAYRLGEIKKQVIKADVVAVNYVYELVYAKIDDIEYGRNILSVENNTESISKILLYPNIPNPFNAVTNITFEISETGFIIVEVYNILGQRVKSLINRKIGQGKYTIEYDGSDLPSGIYFYRIRGDFAIDQVRKMLLVK